MKIKYTIREDLIRAGDYCFFKKENGSFSYGTFKIDKVKPLMVHFETDHEGLWYDIKDVIKGV